MKICVPILNRQTWGRLRLPLQAISKEFTLQLVVGGSAILPQYGDVRPLIRSAGLPITREIRFRPPDDSLGSMSIATGMGIIELTDVFDELRPDYIICHADRYETMAVAIAASYQNIKLIHHQAGEVSGSIDDRVRNAVSELADIHLCATENSASRMGDRPAVFVVGCPAIDAIPENLSLNSLPNLGFGAEIDLESEYYLVTYHPDTRNYGNERQIVQTLIRLIDKVEQQTIWICPNIDAGGEEIHKQLRQWNNNTKPNVRFFSHLDPETYIKVMYNASVCIGNSSSFIREGSYLGCPTVLIGARQIGRELGPNVLSFDNFRQGIADARNFPRTRSTLYGDGKATERILSVLRELHLRDTKGYMLH